MPIHRRGAENAEADAAYLAAKCGATALHFLCFFEFFMIFAVN
jgi:hypothetical protein